MGAIACTTWRTPRALLLRVDCRISSGTGRLKQLDRIAGGVLEEDLLAAGPVDDLVAERHAGRAQPLDVGGDVVDDEVDAIPAPWLWRSAIRHRASSRTLGAAEQQPEVASHDVGKRGGRIRASSEAEVGRVEGHGFLDVVNHVADVYELVRHVGSPPEWRWSRRSLG